MDEGEQEKAPQVGEKLDQCSVSILHQVLNVSNAIDSVQTSKCGAINIFIGTVRDQDTCKLDHPTGNKFEIEKRIKGIVYEAYESMARRQISNIISRVIGDKGKGYVAIRLGMVPVGDASIIICVSSRGRYDSHEATMRILKEIKSSVTIWKKIVFEDGLEQWAGEQKSEAFWLKR